MATIIVGNREEVKSHLLQISKVRKVDFCHFVQFPELAESLKITCFFVAFVEIDNAGLTFPEKADTLILICYGERSACVSIAGKDGAS